MSALIFAKVTLVLALAWIALLLMRRATAALRHTIIAIALLAALLIPLLELALPAWEVLPRPETSLIGQGADRAGMVVNTTPAVAATPARLITRAAVARPTAIGLKQWLLTAWLAGAFVLLVVFFARVAAMELTARRARPVHDRQWHALLKRARAAAGISTPVRLKLRGNGAMPAVWGVRRPVILLPADCVSWPLARRRDVLAHELAHIARRDVVVSMLAHMACVLHWFNPLAWALKRRLALECEFACDDAALAQGMPAPRYADHLLTTAAAYRERNSLAPVMAAPSQLEGRIMAILDTDRNRSGASWRAQFVIIAIAALATVPVSSLAWAQAGDLFGAATRAPGHSDSGEFANHLERLGVDTSDIDALLNGLGATSALTRAASAWALGDIDNPLVIDPLIQAAYDRDAVVRQWAVRSLDAWDAPRIADMLVTRLQDSDAEVRQWAARTLQGHDPAVSTQPLIDKLGDTNAEVREWAVRVLAATGDPRVMPALANHFVIETNAAVSEWLVRALGASEDRQSLQALMNALDSDSPAVRQWAVRGLSGVRDDQVVDALIGTLSDDDDEVREWAVRGLAATGDPRVMPALANHLVIETNAAVSEWLVRALGASEDRQSLQALMNALRSDSPAVRQWAVRGLSGVRDDRVVDALIGTLSDDDDEVREWSARALGVCGNERAITPLRAMSRDPSDAVREWAGRALDAIDC